MLLKYEIAEEYEVTGKQIKTPYGWCDIKKVYKTIPLQVWELHTTHHKLEASGHHLVLTPTGCKEIQSLFPGDTIFTETGLETIFYIAPTNRVEPLYDITIDDERGLFYSQGIVSHNSTTFCARQLIYSHLIPRMYSLYIAPYEHQVSTYGDRMEQMQAMFSVPIGKQNKYSKKFENGSSIRMISCLTTADKARGISADEVLFDECCVACTKVFYCITENERASLINMCDIVVGAKITGFDKNNEHTYVTVTAKQCKGYRPCYRIRTATGKELVCTGNHRIRTDQGWRYAIELAGQLHRRRNCTLAATGGLDYKALFLLWRGDADKPSSTESGRAIEDWEARMFFKGMCECAQLPQKVLIQTEEGRTGWDTIVSIEYAGDQEVWDITTDPHHTFFADGIGTHNCQGMDPEIVPEILYTKTMSELPTVVYSGTALSVDTLLEANWIDSSMGMWHVRAGDGKTWLNMYDKDTLFKVCDNPQGPTCPITGKLLKVTDGCFVHAKQGNMNSGRIGVHIPQCIIPDIAYNAQRWGEVYQKIQRDDPKKVMQECFGIAVSEGSREISERDLMRLCVLTDTEEQLKAKCHNGYYKKVISGCDWGGSDYNPALKTKTSYTVHCIIGISPNGTIDILHYRRYAGMMYDEIARTIIAEHKAYNGYAIASDFGVGLAYNMEIRKHIPFDRHFIMSYVGPTAAPVATPAGAHMQNQLSINRTEALTNVFRDVKKFDPQRIRCRNWGDMQPFLSDWLNMFRVPVEMPGGQNVFKYVRAATKADDALHAFAFAYVIAKIYRGDSLVKDPALEKRIRTVLGAATIGQKEAAVRQELFGMPNYVVSG